MRPSLTTDATPGASVATDAWPRTNRLLPWLIAVFVLALCLVPLDSSQLRVSGPVDLKLDRVLLAPMLLLWICAALVGGRSSPRFPRLGAAGVGLLAWVAIAVLSVAVSSAQLAIDAELLLATKKLILLGSFAAFYFMVASAIRPAEVRPLVTLWLVASAITALDALVTYRTGTAHLRVWFSQVLGAVVQVTPAPEGVGANGRPEVVGPALHGLALTTMMVMAMPFALARVYEAKTVAQRVLPALALVLYAIAAVTTGRRSSIIVPVVLGLVFIAYRPRPTLRLTPLILVFVLASQLFAPAALTSIKARVNGAGEGQASNLGRTSDYDAVTPDIVTRPLLGKGFGTLDPSNYRILDNQLLGSLIETGLVGVVAFLGFLIAAWAGMHRRARNGDDFALAIAAAVVVFTVSTLLYDALAFVQTAYILFFVLALGSVYRSAAASSALMPFALPERRARIDHRWFVTGAAVTGFIVAAAGASAFGQADRSGSAWATAIVRVERRPQQIGQTRDSLRQVNQQALMVSQLVNSGAVQRRVAEGTNLPVGYVGAVSVPPRIEQPSERKFGYGDQRATTLRASRAPVSLSADMILQTPTFRLAVRAPTPALASRATTATVAAIREEIQRIASPERPVYEPVMTSVIATRETPGLPPLLVGLLFAGVFAALAQTMRTVVRTNRAADGPSRGRV